MFQVESPERAHHRLNDAQRWVLAAAGILLGEQHRTFDRIGGVVRPARSGTLAKELQRDFGILTAGDARMVLEQLAELRDDSPELLIGLLRAHQIAAQSFASYLFPLEEAWPWLCSIAARLQRMHSSWLEMGQRCVDFFCQRPNGEHEAVRLEKRVLYLTTNAESPWVQLPWSLSLGDALALPELIQTVRTVDANGSGDFTTIGAALNEANWGDKIRVLEGTYRERLWISAPVEIEGVGEVRIENDLGCCVMVKSSAAVMRNLKLRSGTDPSGEAMHAVIVHHEFLKLIDCEITSARLGLYLASIDGFVSLESTRIHGAANAGILVTDGTLVMRGGGVSKSVFANIQIEGTSESRLEDVALEGAGQSGLTVRKGAEVSVLDSVIANNLSGVDATVAGHVNLIGCRIAGNSGGGVRAFGPNSTLHLEACRLDTNGAVNVGADQSAFVEVFSSDVRGGACAGWADHDAKVSFSGCRLLLGSEGLLREMNGGKIEVTGSQADVQPTA